MVQLDDAKMSTINSRDYESKGSWYALYLLMPLTYSASLHEAVYDRAARAVGRVVEVEGVRIGHTRAEVVHIVHYRKK